MFLKKKAIILIVLGLFLINSCGLKKIETKEDMAKAVFQTIQDTDFEKFENYCVTKEKMKQLIMGLQENSQKEKSIKNEIVNFDVDKARNETVIEFKKLINAIQTNKLDLKKAVYNGIVISETRFEITNLKAVKFRFKVSFEKMFYIIRLDIFDTGKNIYLYDLKMRKYNKIDFNLTLPKKNTIVIKKGESVQVKIDFDAKKANEEGAWIESKFDDKNAGMAFGTSIESPYTDEIPSKFLTIGKHTMSYYLHPSGSDRYKALGEVKLSIEVK